MFYRLQVSINLTLHAGLSAADTILMSTIAAAWWPFHSILIAPHHSIDGLFACIILCHATAFLCVLIVRDVVGVLAADATASTVDFSAALGDRYWGQLNVSHILCRFASCSDLHWLFLRELWLSLLSAYLTNLKLDIALIETLVHSIAHTAFMMTHLTIIISALW